MRRITESKEKCHMQIDRYTKLVLTIIALALAMIACRSVTQPSGVAAEGPLAGVQFSGVLGGFMAFDTRSGDVWGYDITNHKWFYTGKITQLGKPLLEQKNQ